MERLLYALREEPAALSIFALWDTYNTFITEDNKIRKKYEEKEKDLETHLANIEKLLTEVQKAKYNYQRPALLAWVSPFLPENKNLLRIGKV